MDWIAPPPTTRAPRPFAVRGLLRSGACSLLVLLIGANFLCAQATWEYSPYRVQAWIAVERSPLLSSKLVEELGPALTTGTWAAAEYGWQLSVEAAPGPLQSELLQRMDSLTFEALLDANGKTPACDKLFLIAVREHDSELEATVREWDLPTRVGGETVRLRTFQPEVLPELVLKGVLDAFRPLVKIERVEGKNIVARLRAGGLITSEDSPLKLNPGALLHPVIRRNQRNGEPLPNGILTPAWTYLETKSRENSVLQCSLQTGFAGVVPAKGGPRVERLALAVKRNYPSTLITILSRKDSVPADANASKRAKAVSRPLADYEIYAKEPGSENTISLGLTDWQGRVRLEQDEHALRLLYVRNGSQFLARLPVVVGHLPELSIEVFDDDPRLYAETKIRSLQSRMMDIVVRREILTARLRAGIKKGAFEEANKLLAEFRALPQRMQLQRELEDERLRMANVPGLTGKRISALFVEGNRLLTKFLDPDTANQLAKELAEAQRAPVPRAPPPAKEPVPEKPAAPLISNPFEKSEPAEKTTP